MDRVRDMRTIRERWVPLVFLAVLLAPSPAYALQQGADPGINQPYANPDFETWVGRFERPGREVYDKRQEIVAATGVDAGMEVADIGAGTGLFTLLFATKVGPDGRVYAVDISRGFVENILRRAREKGLRNVEGVVNSQNSADLAPQSVDLVFISDTYHHFERPQEMLQSIRDALRPGGTLVIIDYRRAEGASSAWVMEHVRAGKDTVIREVEAAGFDLAKDEDFLQQNFFLRFIKRDGRNAVH